MIITNKYNLPQSLVRAVTWQPDEPDYDYRVSELVNSPRIVQLRRRHDAEITVDVSDMLYILDGLSIHYILEKGAGKNELAEERLIVKIGNIKIKGQPDLLRDEESLSLEGYELIDYKRTSVWSYVFHKNGRPEWQAAQNVYRFLLADYGFDIRKLSVCCLFRDWVKSRRFEADYPDIPAKMIELPIWENPKDYILDRLAVHEQAKFCTDDKLPLCSKEERWERPTKYALMKQGRKSAVKLWEDKHFAAAAQLARGDDYYIEIRTGQSVRCAEYCQVKPWCDFGKQITNGGK